MTATNAFETALLNLYFNNTDHANVGDAGGIQNSAAAGVFWATASTDGTAKQVANSNRNVLLFFMNTSSQM